MLTSYGTIVVRGSSTTSASTVILDISNSTFTNNTAYSTTGAGAIYLSVPTNANCQLSANTNR